MRKVYIIRANEEDGRLLDALAAAGHSLDESALENPVCPRCGGSTLLAFADDEQFEVVLWEQVEETDGADAHAWYLICGQFECTYQEEIERVLDPMGAEIFDQELAQAEFEDYSGMMDSHPIEMLELIEDLRAVLATGQNHKLACMLEEAEWRYEESMQWRWNWIRRVPLGKRVRFSLFDDNDNGCGKAEEIEGTFVSITDDGFLILRAPGEELMLVRARELDNFQPCHPERQELPKPRIQEIAEAAGNAGGGDATRKRQVIYGGPPNQWVVIRGYHLRFDSVNRLGLYKVRCWDPAAAKALSLTPRGERYWEGRFRRSDLEARYDLKCMVKARGHWVDVVGTIGEEQGPYVRTDDPVIAAALGLREQKPLHPPETEEEIRRYRRSWSGGVEECDIEDRREVRLYHWPIPEFHQP